MGKLLEHVIQDLIYVLRGLYLLLEQVVFGVYHEACCAAFFVEGLDINKPGVFSGPPIT